MPYEAQVKAIEAQLKLSGHAAVADDAALRARRRPRLRRRAAAVRSRPAQGASSRARKWNLDKTVVRAPADGYVTNLALRKGARVANLPLAPVMAFIDTSDTIIGVEIAQIDARYIEPGQEVEITFKFVPGQVYTGKVESMLQAIATGQTQTSGHGRDAEGGRDGAVRGARQARRRRIREEAAGRRDRHGGDLHRTRQGDAHHPPACCCGRSRSSTTSIRSERGRFHVHRPARRWMRGRSRRERQRHKNGAACLQTNWPTALNKARRRGRPRSVKAHHFNKLHWRREPKNRSISTDKDYRRRNK